ncbi:unnamed protein product, partial [Vitis vinifera]
MSYYKKGQRTRLAPHCPHHLYTMDTNTNIFYQQFFPSYNKITFFFLTLIMYWTFMAATPSFSIELTGLSKGWISIFLCVNCCSLDCIVSVREREENLNSYSCVLTTYN